MPDSIIITGASRGVGLAIAQHLANEGYRIIAIARSEGQELPAARAALTGPGEIIFRAFDLADVEGIGEFVRALRAEFGAPYALINNAALGTDGLLANMHLSQIEALVRVNTLSPIVLTKYVARAMMAAGRGRIVNISSIIGSTGYSGLSVYGATKASLPGARGRPAGRHGQRRSPRLHGHRDDQVPGRRPTRPGRPPQRPAPVGDAPGRGEQRRLSAQRRRTECHWHGADH